MKPGPPCCLCTHLEVRKPWESQQCRSAFTLKQADEEREVIAATFAEGLIIEGLIIA